MLAERRREEALLHFRRGCLLESAYRADEAAREYRMALDHDPHLCEALAALASYYRRCGLLAKAAEQLELLAALRDDLLTRYQLGCLLADLGRGEAAVEQLERCLALAPDDPQVLLRLAAAHAQCGEHVAALARLREHVAGWEAHQLRGECLVRLGSYAQAEAAFAAAAQAAPPERGEQLRRRGLVARRYSEHGAARSIRDWLYLEHGALLIGSPQLDSSRREPVDYPLLYADIRALLSRMAGLAAALGWRFSCVMPASQGAQPAAAALAGLLGAPLARSPHGERPLLVLAGGYQSAVLDLAPPGAATLCIGLGELRRHARLPELVGVAAHGACGIPWEPELRRLRAAGAGAAAIGACLADAADRIAAAAPRDGGLERLVAYYQARPHHRMVL